MVGNYIFENICEHKLSTMYLVISNLLNTNLKDTLYTKPENQIKDLKTFLRSCNVLKYSMSSF